MKTPKILKTWENKRWYFDDLIDTIVEYQNGTKMWYQNNRLHRDDGPAIEYIDGTKVWVINDEYHRINGPAIIFHNGNTEWWLNGEHYTEEEYKIKINQMGLKKDLFLL